MRLLIGFIGFFAKNPQLTLLLLLFSHHSHYVNGGNTEVDINLMPATQQEQNVAAYTNENSNFFHTNGDIMENSDVESVPITIGGGNGGSDSANFGGNVSMSNGNHAGKMYNWDDYMGSIDMYSESGDYDYGKCIKQKKN